MQKLLGLFFSLLVSSSLIAQDGDYFVLNFTPNVGDRDAASYDLTFSSNGELFAANTNGILTFDGIRWRLIKTPTATLSLDLNEENSIYVGGAGDFGALELIEGEYQFKSLAIDSLNDIVFQTLSAANKVVFLTEEYVYVYDEQSEETKKIEAPESDVFQVIFEFDNRIFVQSEEKLFEILESGLTPTYLLPNQQPISVISEKSRDGKYLMSNDAGELYLFDKKLKKLKLKSDYFITDIVWTSESIFSISTLSNGIQFYDINLGVQIGEVDGQKGLPDNEVFAIASDHFGGLWIANEFGFSRIAPDLPVRYYNYYPGLEGNLIDVARLGDTWYLATSKGVFYFDEIEKYKNVVYYVKKNSSSSTSNSNNKKSKKRKGLFAKSSKKKEKKGGNIFDNLKLNLGGYERKVRKELVSTSYVYKPIAGLSDKVKKIIPFKDRLLCLTPSGIAEIKNKEASMIYEYPARNIFVDEDQTQLLISDDEGEVHIFELSRNFWIRQGVVEIPGDIVISFHQEGENDFWMAGASGLYRLSTGAVQTITESYELDNPYFDEVRITKLNSRLFLTNKQGFFFLNEEEGKLEKDTKMLQKVGLPQNHLQQKNGLIWVYDGLNWKRIESDESLTEYSYLKLAPRMTSIDELDNNLWIINDNKTLLKYQPSASDSIPSSNMYFRKIQVGSGLLEKSSSAFSVDYESSRFDIEMARPDYLNLLNIEYQYMIKGISDEWSPWSANNQINFSYLPAGQYSLLVKSRDALGRIQESEPFKFEVIPPYWQTAWFKGAQVLFFVILVFGSARLNRKGDEKYKLLTSILTIVTVVMIIELLQNIAGGYFDGVQSALLAFVIDVMVALLVFPIEQVLKKIVSGQHMTEVVPLDKIKEYVPLGNKDEQKNSG